MECGTRSSIIAVVNGAIVNWSHEPRNGTKVCTRITRGLYLTVTESFPELHAEG